MSGDHLVPREVDTPAEAGNRSCPSQPAPEDGRFARGFGLVFLIIYLKTLCPTVYLGDAGEIATAITTGGIVHPPGYPIFSILGGLALRLVPVGEPAFRIGCVTALSAALGVCLLYLLAREARISSWSAAVAAAVFGFSFTFWSQSTRVEVYSTNVLFGVAVLWATLRYRRTGALRDIALAALSAGLGLGHHLTIGLLAPGVFVLAGARLWRDPGVAVRVAICAALILVGPASYFLLYFWAKGDPVHNWGRPSTLPLLWNHATAAIYQYNLAAPDPEHLSRSLPIAWKLLTDNFPYGIALGIPIGAVVLGLKQRAAFFGLLLVVLSIVGYNQCYRITDIAGYYLIPWAVFAVFLAAGLDLIRFRLPESSRRAVLVGLACLLPGLCLSRNWNACDLSGAVWMREFARQKLECTDKDGILITQWDPDTFPIWYVQEVLGVRPDVIVVDRSLVRVAYWNHDRDPSEWYLTMLKRRGMFVPEPASRGLATRIQLGNDGLLLKWVKETMRDRAWCSTFGVNPTIPENKDQQVLQRWLQRYRLTASQGMVLRFHLQTRQPRFQDVLALNNRLWDHIELPELGAIRLDQDLAPEYVMEHYAAMLGNYAELQLQAGKPEVARRLYEEVVRWAPQSGGARTARIVLQRIGASQSPTVPR